MRTTTELIELYKGDAPGYPYKYIPNWNHIISYNAFSKALENAALTQDYVGVETILDTFTHHHLPGGYADGRYQVLTELCKKLPCDEKITKLFNQAKDTLRPYFQRTYDEQPWAFD